MASNALTLEHRIANLAATVPGDVLDRLCRELVGAAASDIGLLRLRLLASVTNPAVREQFAALFEAWAARPEISAAGLALALRSASITAVQSAAASSVELVWTGPGSSTRMRRTDQALLELIQSAQRELLIVSFAVYDVTEILDALARAVQRGVTVTMCIESSDVSAGRTARASIARAGQGLEQALHLYHWPTEQRPVDNGKPAAFHAKCAVADEHSLFTTSANLTGHALAINIELGVLIRGGSQPGEVRRHFRQLIQGGVLLGT